MSHFRAPGAFFALSTLGIAAYASAQMRSPAVVIETRGANTYVSVTAPRPLYQAVIAVSQKYGWIVDYEDPIYSAQESRDITAPAWRSSHPHERGFLTPSGGPFVANLGEIDEKNPNEADLLGKLIEQYNGSANPGYFRVIHTSDGRFVVSGESRIEARSTFKGALDAVYQPAKKPEDAGTALEQLANQCSANSGVSIKLGIVPGNATGATTVPGTDGSISCRAGIDRILASMAAAVEYVLLYDIGDRAYFLSVVPAQKIAIGANGRPAIVPVRKPAK